MPPRAWLAAPRALPLVVLGGAAALALTRASSYRALAQEDGWIEWATFLVFAGAGALAFIGAARGPSIAWRRLALLGLGIFCVFVAGEEISWGQRALSFVPPALFLERNFQQELNLHNLLKGIFDSRWQVFTIAVGYGAAAVMAARRGWLPEALAPAPTLVPAFLGVALLELLYPFDLAGELAELALGLTIAADVTTRTTTDPLGGGRRAVLLQAGSLAAAVLLAIGLDRPDPERDGEARAEVALLGDDLGAPGAVTPKMRTKQRVHKRLFTAVRSGYLRVGVESTFLERQATIAEREGGRADRRGYFVDPWGQPYWIVAQPLDTGVIRVLVYSFGANRKRDSDPDDLARSRERVLRGDDVGVVVDVDLASP